MTGDETSDKIARRFQDPYDLRGVPYLRSWGWYTDEPAETDPIELVRALGLVSATSRSLDSRLYVQIHEALLLDELSWLADQLGAPPSPREMKTFGEYAPREYVQRFGSWTAALDAADVDVSNFPRTDQERSVDWSVGDLALLPPWRSNETTDEDLLRELREFASLIHAPPKPVDVQKFGTYRADEYIRRFGSWSGAVSAAGITPPTASRTRSGETATYGIEPLPFEDDRTVTDEELNSELRRLAQTFRSDPTPSDMQKFGRFSPNDYLSRFASWDAALSAAGITGGETTSTGPWLWTRIARCYRSVKHRLQE